MVFEPEGLYKGTYDVVMQRAFVEKNPGVVKKMVSALLKAEKFIKQNRGRAIQVTANHTGIDEDAIGGFYGEYDYEIKLDKSLLKLLDEQAEWAISSSVSKATQKPDFSKYVYSKALSDVAPDRVDLR